MDCASLTTVLAAGIDDRFCAMKFRPKRGDPHFNSDSTPPYADFCLCPIKALAAGTLDEAKKLIDRSIADDATFPPRTGGDHSTVIDKHSA